jgi:hypothetical protein
MMSYILGKQEEELSGTAASIKGYELAVQRLHQSPDTTFLIESKPTSVRKLLEGNWGSNFQSYVLKKNNDSYVEGVIWELDEIEYELVRYWDLVDQGWYGEFQGVAVNNQGQSVPIVSLQLGEGQEIDRIAHPREYNPWLQSPEQYKEITAKSRHSYFRENRQYKENVSGLKIPKPDYHRSQKLNTLPT